MTPTQTDERALEPAERIVATAYDLFARHGVRGIGVDEIIRAAGVAKASFYKYFPSKDELVLAFLERREELWTEGWVEAEAAKRGDSPEERLLAIFDLLDEWFRQDDFEGCSFINVLLEMRPPHPAGEASIQHLRRIRAGVRALAKSAGLRDPEGFAHSWHLLMKGSIVTAAEGDVDAARRAKAMARALLDAHRS